MKKLISVMLTMILCISLSACGGNSPETTSGTQAPGTTAAQETSLDAWVQGVWIHDEFDGKGDSLMDTNLPEEFLFEDGKVTVTCHEMDTPVSGTYTVEDNVVTCQLGEDTITLEYLDDMLIFSDNAQSRWLLYFFGGEVPGGEAEGGKITVMEAEAAARKYASSSACKNKLLDKANAHRMEFFEITSVSSTGSGSIRVTIKGNFFGHDEYGVLKDHYAFTVVVPVSGSDGRVLERSVSVTVRSA